MAGTKASKAEQKKELSTATPSSLNAAHFVKLHLENWQSHKSTDIEFDPRFTAVVGASNSGKSSIVRALRRVIRDEGPTAVRHGETATKIELTLQRGTIARELRVRRVAGKKAQLVENTYRAQDQLFKAVDGKVPQEVLNLHQLGPGHLSAYGLDLHFSSQLDEVFLLQGTASLRSKVLAKLSGVEVLDRCVQIINGETRHNKDEDTRAEQAIAQLQARLVQFVSVEEWQAELTEIEALWSSLDSAEQTYHRRVDALTSFNRVRQQRRLLRAKQDAYAVLAPIEERLGALQRIQELLKGVDASSYAVAAAEARLVAAQTALAAAEDQGRAFADTSLSICPTCSKPLSEIERQQLLSGAP